MKTDNRTEFGRPTGPLDRRCRKMIHLRGRPEPLGDIASPVVDLEEVAPRVARLRWKSTVPDIGHEHHDVADIGHQRHNPLPVPRQPNVVDAIARWHSARRMASGDDPGRSAFDRAPRSETRRSIPGRPGVVGHQAGVRRRAGRRRREVHRPRPNSTHPEARRNPGVVARSTPREQPQPFGADNRACG